MCSQPRAWRNLGSKIDFQVTLKVIFLPFFLIFGAYLFLHYDLYIFLTDSKKAIEFIQSFHPYDDFVFIALQIFQVLIAGALPAELTGFIGGYLYGPVLGTIYSTAGLSVGSWLAFFLARIYGLPLVRRVVKASVMQRYDHFMHQRGPSVSFILFLMPGFPKAALCYIIGLSPMKIWTFMAVSTAGRLFGTILLSVSGSSVRNNQGMVFLAIVGIVGVIFLFAYFYRGRLTKMKDDQFKEIKKKGRKSIYLILIILIGPSMFMVIRPTMAGGDVNESRGETSSTYLDENAGKGREDTAGDSAGQPTPVCGWSNVPIPKSSYEITDKFIPKLLGVQLPGWIPKILGLQFTGIYQNMPAFHNPYQGANSLRFDHGLGQQFTHSYGIYFGSQVTRWLQAYLDVEMFQGSGISNGLGLGGYVNGDLIRAGSANLGHGPYIARFYLRYLIPLTGERAEPAAPAMDQLPSPDPTSRVEIRLGRLAPTDDIDLNRYANNPRTQFLNYAFLYNPAWDYPSDTRGYSQGITVSLVEPIWKLTFGYFQINTIANGMNLDWRIGKTGGYNVELTLKPSKFGTLVRFLGYYNQGNMGRYRDALEIAVEHSTTPDVIGLDEKIHRKYGFGINLEQPLADNGETGLFARAGWSDGHTSTWSYTEADRHISAGVQVSGTHWKRPKDHFGIAYAVHGLSTLHKRYLEAGGLGMLLGDGKLNYGLEQIFEVYYLLQVCRYLQISPDFQYIRNPGYNRDRGPAQVYGLRFHVTY